jgi:hypothetical protein
MEGPELISDRGLAKADSGRLSAGGRPAALSQVLARQERLAHHSLGSTPAARFLVDRQVVEGRHGSALGPAQGTAAATMYLALPRRRAGKAG